MEAEEAGTMQPGGENNAAPLPLHLQGKRGNGFMGDGALKPGRANLRLVRRAIKNNWPVPNDLKQSIIDQLRLLVEASDDEEIIIKAAKAIMDAANQNTKLLELELKAIDLLLKQEREDREAREKINQPAGGTTVNVNINTDSHSRRSEALAILTALSERAGNRTIDGTAEPAAGENS
jgi:hypothetical protein